MIYFLHFTKIMLNYSERRIFMKNYFIGAALLLVSVSCINQSAEKNNSVPDPLRINVPTDGTNSLAGTFISTRTGLAKEQTEVFVKAEKKGLILNFHCYGEPKKTVFSAKKPDDDMTLFGGEHIEFQLSPNGAKDRIYYHFAINPAGAVYHAKNKDTKWNPGNFTCKITDFKDYRQFAVELPWQIFGLSEMPSAGTVWKANFCRAAKIQKSPIEFSSWSGAISYHDINQMGELVFGGRQNALLRFFNNKISLNTTQNDNGKYSFQLLLNGQINTNKALHKNRTIDFRINAKNKYVPAKSMDKITLRLLKNKCIVWEKSAFDIAKNKEFMLLDKFEYTKDSDLKCQVTSLPGKLTIKNESKILLQKKITSTPAVISLKNLPSGRYTAEYSSKSEYSDRVFFITGKITPPAPLKKGAKLTANGEKLMLDGEPFYLLGISGGSKAHYQNSPGFTLLYGQGGRKNAFMFQSFPGKKFIRKPFTAFGFRHDWQELTGKYLARQKKSTLNYWRNIAYEATFKIFIIQKDGSLTLVPDSHKVFKQIYDMAKAAMPDSLFSIHIDQLHELHNYTDSCDILEFASWRSSYHPSNLLFYQGEDLDFVRQQIGSKPIVMWLGGCIPNPYVRSAEEIRAGVYNTIINGGAGNIIHMGHGGVPAFRTRFWSMLSMLQREIDSFYPELQKGTPFELNLPSDFAAKAVITQNKELLLVILNKSAFSQTLTLNYPPYQSQTVNFTPFEPRVIRLSKKLK